MRFHSQFQSLSGLPGFVLGCCLLALTPAIRAQTLYWDVNGKTSGTGANPTGTWSTSSSTWNSNANGTGNSIGGWTNGGNAIFSAGTNGTGAYTVTVSGTVDVSSITVQEGTPTFNGGTIRFTGTPDFTVNTGLVATVNSVLADYNYSGLNKAGTGELILGGNNTFAAPATISAGTLTLASNNALGATGTWGNTISSGATLALQGGITVNEGSFNVSGTGAGGIGAIVNASGNNTLGGTLTLQGDTTVGSTAGTLTLTSDLAASNNLTTTGAGNVTFSGGGYGSGSITQAGTGTLTFSGASSNSLSGVLNINSGTVSLAKTGGANATSASAINIGDGSGAAGSAVLRLDGSNQIADYAGLITIAADGVLNVNGFTEKVNALTSTGGISLGTGSLTVGVNSGNVSLGGTISGAGTLIKEGSGTLALLSSIVLAGELQLNAGTLALGGYNLTAGTLHITGNSTIDFAGGNSTLSVTNFIIDAGVTLTVQNWTNAADFFYAQGWTGASYDTKGASPMNQVVFSGSSSSSTFWQSYDQQVTPVPEPATYGLILLLGAGGLAGWRRFRTGRRA